MKIKQVAHRFGRIERIALLLLKLCETLAAHVYLQIVLLAISNGLDVAKLVCLLALCIFTSPGHFATAHLGADAWLHVSRNRNNTGYLTEASKFRFCSDGTPI